MLAARDISSGSTRRSTRANSPPHVNPAPAPAIDALSSVAGAVAVAIRREQAEREVHEAQEMLEQRVVERTRELSGLLEVSRNVASTLDLGRLLGLILDQLNQVVGYTGCSILTRDGDDLVIVDTRGPFTEAARLTIGTRFPIERMQSFWSDIEQGRTIVLGDVLDGSVAAQNYDAVVGPLRETPS